MPPVCESEVRRAIGNGKRRCRDEIHGIGDGCDNRARHDDLFRMPPSAACERQYAIASADVLHACSAFEHDTGDLQAGNEWQLGFDLVFALNHQDVGKVDAGSAHADADLSGAEGWARNLSDLEVTDAVQRATKKCAHDTLHRGRLEEDKTAVMLPRPSLPLPSARAASVCRST